MKKLISFIRQERGGMALLFALILPFIISCCALAFDGARLMSKKARLADALNEAALAIATASTVEPTEAERIKLQTLLNRYIKTYLPNDRIITSSLDVSYIQDGATGSDIPVFDLYAKVNVKTLLPLSHFASFEKALDISNHGKVRKGGQSFGGSADYVFLLDFSEGMELPSPEAGLTRLELLKKVVRDITTQSIEANPETTFAIVPFDTAVMVRYPDKNELGGHINGCSILMVPNKQTHVNLGMENGYDIDYDFWANKLYGLRSLPLPSASSTSLPYSINTINNLLDTERYNYFRNYVIPSLTRELGRTATWDDLVSRGWCVKNDSSVTNRPMYTCEKDPNKSIYTAENQAKIQNEFLRARNVIQTYTSNLNTYSLLNANNNVMDIEATLDGMFDEANIITFPMMYWDNHYYANQGMCQTTSNGTGNDTNDQLADVVPQTYLIESTSDLSVLEEFQNMVHGRNSISSAGLLRAVPEMLKGSNPRTALIIISIAADNETVLQNKLHRDRPAGDRICDRIRSGVKARKPGTESVDIYFITMVRDPTATRTEYWGEYCTGEDNAVTATDYDELMSKLTGFMNKQFEETGYFYN